MKGMAGAEDMMAGMKSTTGMEKGAETTREDNRNEGESASG